MNSMSYDFFALISRMKYIVRWSLMRNSQSEDIQQHSHATAVIAALVNLPGGIQRMSVASVQRTWTYILEVLRRLK